MPREAGLWVGRITHGPWPLQGARLTDASLGTATFEVCVPTPVEPEPSVRCAHLPSCGVGVVVDRGYKERGAGGGAEPEAAGRRGESERAGR